MKEIALPQEDVARKKKARSLRALRKFTGGAMFVLAILAIACLIGVLVVVILTQTGERDPARDTLLYILTGAFAGGAVVLALAAFGTGVLTQRVQEAELDYLERLCGKDCFYVGDGTVAQFGGSELFIRSESEQYKKARIRIPYREVICHSVCTRKAPREKGKWSVVLEVPAHYVQKRGGAPKAFIETDGKERLYRILEERGLRLQGEQPPRGAKQEDTRFPLTAKLLLPDEKKRRRNLIYIVLSAVLMAAGALVAVFWQEATLVGAIVCVLGGVFLARSIAGFVRAKGMLGLGEAGLYWRESGDAVADKLFLKWEVVCSVGYETAGEKRYLAVVCPFGTYHLPDIEGAYEWIAQMHPELV